MCSRFETNPIFAIIHSKSELRSLSACKGDVDSYIKQYHAVCIYIILISVIFLKKETDIERKSVTQAQSKTKMETELCASVTSKQCQLGIICQSDSLDTHTLPVPLLSCLCPFPPSLSFSQFGREADNGTRKTSSTW